MSPLLAQSRHRRVEFRCPLLGVKRTSLRHAEMSAYDPKRTSGGIRAGHVMDCLVIPINTAKPPAVRGQRLCLRPPIQCRAPDTARWVVEPAEELEVRLGKHSAGRCRGSVGKPTPKRMASRQTGHNL